MIIKDPAKVTELEFFLGSQIIFNMFQKYHEFDKVLFQYEIGTVYEWFNNNHLKIKKLLDKDFYQFEKMRPKEEFIRIHFSTLESTTQKLIDDENRLIE
jgi:hypothetical protein